MVIFGRLARSGKVRNQTPKKSKQQKIKKVLQGRAKKKKQYNKRILGSQNSQSKFPALNFQSNK